MRHPRPTPPFVGFVLLVLPTGGAGVALGALLAAEPVTAQVLLGGVVIVAGVAVVVSTERPRRPVDGAAAEVARR